MRLLRVPGVALLVVAPLVLGGCSGGAPQPSPGTSSTLAAPAPTGVPVTPAAPSSPTESAPAGQSSTPRSSASSSAGAADDGGPFDVAPQQALPASRYLSTPDLSPVEDTDDLHAIEQHGATVVLVVDRVTVTACADEAGAATSCPDDYRVTNDNPRLRRYPLAGYALLRLLVPDGQPGASYRPTLTQLEQFVTQNPDALVNLRFDDAGRISGLAQPWHP